MAKSVVVNEKRVIRANVLFHETVLQQICSPRTTLWMLQKIIEYTGINIELVIAWQGKEQSFIQHVVDYWIKDDNLVTHSKLLHHLLTLDVTQELPHTVYVKIAKHIGLRIRQLRTVESDQAKLESLEAATSLLFDFAATQVTRGARRNAGIVVAGEDEESDDEAVIAAEFDRYCAQLVTGVIDVLPAILATISGTEKIGAQQRKVHALLLHAIYERNIKAIDVLLQWKHIDVLYQDPVKNVPLLSEVIQIINNGESNIAILYKLFHHSSAAKIVNPEYYKIVIEILNNIPRECWEESHNKLYIHSSGILDYYDLCMVFAQNEGREAQALHMWFLNNEIEDILQQYQWINFFKYVAQWQKDDNIMLSTLAVWEEANRARINLAQIIDQVPDMSEEQLLEYITDKSAGEQDVELRDVMGEWISAHQSIIEVTGSVEG